MAILQRDRFVSVDKFIDGLRQAAASVVRVSMTLADGSPLEICSGWFIAPHLVVVPGYSVSSRALAGDARLGVEVRSEGRVKWHSDVKGPPETLGTGALAAAPQEPAIAVLYVKKSARDRVLPLCFETPLEGDLVTLVHYPARLHDAAVSSGRIRSVETSLLAYDASTAPGSSGAPVLDQAFRVVAMHAGRHGNGELNQGLTRAAFVEMLRASRWWSTIAAHHRLADDSTAAQTIQQSGAAQPSAAVDPILIRAAVTVSLERESLAESERAHLRGLVADPSAARWTLRPGDRRAIIQSVGSLDALKVSRGSDSTSNPAQLVIDAILAGPPYDWASANEEALGWWLQATRWFEGVARDLPSPSQVANLLERRRVRSRLDRIAGPGFRGRARELEQLRAWAADPSGPLALTGVGGVGKSALVARFASEQPAETLLLWLDFDRADIAPDDADSVLAAIADQAATQLDGLEKPRLTGGDWQSAGGALGLALAPALASQPPPMLVLDSFEAAQYAERYQELWPVLERLCEWLPALRVIVTGRAPVPGLVLQGRSVVHIHLKGLETDDARRWLGEKGIVQPAILERVLALADGIPLILRLAVRYLEQGGAVADVPRDLPSTIVAGYLYDRILDRVQNGEYKPLASGALVLRRLSADMIAPVLGGLVSFPAGEPSEWIAELSREVGLVEGSDVLQLRPEVRAATLELLERDRPELVQEIDKRASDWYAAQAFDQPDIAAERVYHLLRLGRLEDAVQAWRDGAGSYLLYADEEIRDVAARDWLRARLGTATPHATSVETWEQTAAERIRQVRGRKHTRAVKEILKERHDRTDTSPLVFQEAFELRRTGDLAAARALLERSGEVAGPVGRDRRALRALLAADTGDRQTADALLAGLEPADQWTDRASGELDSLAIQAARVRLTVDVEAETRLLAGLSDREVDMIRSLVTPVDAVLPKLKQCLRLGGSIEVGDEPIILDDDARPPRLDLAVEELRQRPHGGLFLLYPTPELPARRELRRERLEQWARGEPWIWQGGELDRPDLPADRAATLLAELGWRRWWLVSSRDFLSRGYALCRDQSRTGAPLTIAILATLAIFATRIGRYMLTGSDGPLGRVIRRHPTAREPIHMSLDRWLRIKPILDAGVSASTAWDRQVRTHLGSAVVVAEELMSHRFSWLTDEGESAFVLSLLAPDPLQQLVGNLAGQSDRPA